MMDRRISARITPATPLVAKIRTLLPAMVVDLSTRGVQLETSTALTPRTHCDLHFSGDGAQGTLRATVRRCSVYGRVERDGTRILIYRAGLEFDAPNRGIIEVLGENLTPSSGPHASSGAPVLGKQPSRPRSDAAIMGITVEIPIKIPSGPDDSGHTPIRK